MDRALNDELRATLGAARAWLGEWIEAMGAWTLSLGKPLAVGLVALALSLALIGYVAVQVGWRAYVTLAWRKRKRRAGSP